MTRSRKAAVERYHDRVAGHYDHSYDDTFWQWHDSLTWDYLKPFLPKDANAGVVDLGCGTGKWAGRVAKSGYRVTCVDISIKMLDQARLKLREQGPEGKFRFLQADLCDLSALRGNAFQLATALGDPIGCTESPVQAMRQIYQMLAAGGVLVATFDNRLAALEFHVSQGDPAAVTRFLRDGVTHWLTRDAGERFPIHTFSPADIAKLASVGGFEVVDMVGKTVLPMRQHRELLATPDARRRWASIEKSLCRNPYALGRASHLQVVFRAVSESGRREKESPAISSK